LSGSLLHAKAFRVQFYNGGDGRPHYEVLPLDGDYDFICYSTWQDIKKHCASLGIAEELWPDFTEYPDTIDLPLDLVRAKQEAFRQAIKQLPPEALSFNHWLARLARHVENGETVFFC